MNMSFNFEGSTVLVTGAGRNIGRACAVEFARAGANVAINVRRNRQEAEQVVDEARAFGVKAQAYLADVSDYDQVRAMVEAVETDLGFVDIYVSSVGLRPRQSFEEITLDDWHRVLETNLGAPFFLAKLLVAEMKQKRRGRIIHISGRDGFVGKTMRAHTVTTKAGLHGFAKALALELADFGITVNTVVPGKMDTTRPREHYPNWDPVKGAMEVPLKRLGDPKEIAWACLYLASQEAGYITGQSIHVNGGLSMF